jgi:hypothetical protein
VPTAEFNLGTLKEALANLVLAPAASVSKSLHRVASKALELVGTGSIIGLEVFIGYAKLALTSVGHVGVSGTKATAATLALAPRAWQFINQIVAFCVMSANTLKSYIAAPGRQLFLSLVAERARALIAKTWDMFWKAKYVYEEYGPYRNRGVLRMKPWGGMGVSQKWGSGGVKMAPEAWAIAHPQRGVSNVSLAGIGFMQRGAAHPYIEETAVIIALDGLAIPIEFQPAAGYVKIDGIGYFDRGTV